MGVSIGMALVDSLYDRYCTGTATAVAFAFARVLYWYWVLVITPYCYAL